MNRSEIARRDFLRKVAVATMGITFEGTNVGSAASGSVRIEEPFHGAVLNRRHGKQVNDGLEIQVSGTAPLRDRVTVNGTPAQRAGARFTSKVVLRQNQTDIVALSQGSSGRNEHRVRVVWDKHSYPRYRFSIDDNSFFLRDIAKQNYPSLFDCFYLKGLRELHSKYGVKFVLNIYYTTGPTANPLE